MLFFPDEIRHNNDNYALIDINSLRGIINAADIATRDSWPSDKRMLRHLAIIGDIFYVYTGLTTDNSDWTNAVNWKSVPFADNIIPPLDDIQTINSAYTTIADFIANEVSGYTMEDGDIVIQQEGRNTISYVYDNVYPGEQTNASNYFLLSYFQGPDYQTFVVHNETEFYNATVKISQIEGGEIFFADNILLTKDFNAPLNNVSIYGNGKKLVMHNYDAEYYNLLLDINLIDNTKPFSLRIENVAFEGRENYLFDTIVETSRTGIVIQNIGYSVTTCELYLQNCTYNNFVGIDQGTNPNYNDFIVDNRGSSSSLKIQIDGGYIYSSIPNNSELSVANIPLMIRKANIGTGYIQILLSNSEFAKHPENRHGNLVGLRSASNVYHIVKSDSSWVVCRSFNGNVFSYSNVTTDGASPLYIHYDIKNPGEIKIPDGFYIDEVQITTNALSTAGNYLDPKVTGFKLGNNLTEEDYITSCDLYGKATTRLFTTKNLVSDTDILVLGSLNTNISGFQDAVEKSIYATFSNGSAYNVYIKFKLIRFNYETNIDDTGATPYKSRSNNFANVDGSNIDVNAFNAALMSQIISSDLIVYVNNVSGNDSTGDGSLANPYATLLVALTKYKYFTITNEAKLTFQLINTGTDYEYDGTELNLILSTINSTNRIGSVPLNIEGTNISIGNYTFTKISLYQYTTNYPTTIQNELKGCTISGTNDFIVESATNGELVVNPNSATSVAGTKTLYSAYTILKSKNNSVADLNLSMGDGKYQVQFNKIRIRYDISGTARVNVNLADCHLINASIGTTRALTNFSKNVRLNKVIFDRFRCDIGSIEFASRLVFIGDANVDGGGLITMPGQVTNIDRTSMFINCNIAIRLVSSLVIGRYDGSLTGLFFKNNSSILSITNESSTLNVKAFTLVSEQYFFTGVQNFFSGTPKNGTRILFNNSLSGTLPALTYTPLIDIDKDISIIIPNITPNYEPITNFATIVEINLLNSYTKFVSCTETGKIYKYVALGSAYTVDNDNVLATADGGDTRFVNISIVENYTPIAGTTVERTFVSEPFNIVEDTPLQVNHPFGTTVVDVDVIQDGESIGLRIYRYDGYVTLLSSIGMSNCVAKITG